MEKMPQKNKDYPRVNKKTAKSKANRHKYFTCPYPPVTNTCLADKLKEVLEKSKD